MKEIGRIIPTCFIGSEATRSRAENTVQCSHCRRLSQVSREAPAMKYDEPYYWHLDKRTPYGEFDCGQQQTDRRGSEAQMRHTSRLRLTSLRFWNLLWQSLRLCNGLLYTHPTHKLQNGPCCSYSAVRLCVSPASEEQLTYTRILPYAFTPTITIWSLIDVTPPASTKSQFKGSCDLRGIQTYFFRLCNCTLSH